MISFYIYPDVKMKRRHRVEVIVCDTRREMRKAIREFFDGEIESDGMAWCVDVVCETQSGRRSPTFSKIIFNRVDLLNGEDHSLDTISHECIHAAFNYAKRVGDNVYIEDGEETVCYAAGSLIGQLHAELTSRKVRH